MNNRHSHIIASSGLFFLIALVTQFVLPSNATAEPYMAVRTGMKCSQCHLNQTGGGGRTDYGNAYTQYKLVIEQSQRLVREANAEGITSFNPKLNEAVTIGANFRMEQQYKTEEGALSADNQLRDAEANLYINVELVKDFLSLYIDQHMTTGANREMWVMTRNLPLNSYIKVGRTLLPYGLRIIDIAGSSGDQAFIRSETGYTYGTRAYAWEAGLEPGPFSLIVSATADRFSTVGSVVFRHFRVGGSYATNTERDKFFPVRDGGTFDAVGPFFGANYGRFTLLGEVDFISKADSPDDTSSVSVAHFYEVNFLAMQGVNLKTSYEFFDRNTSVANRRDGQDRLTLGVEAFPVQHLQLGLYYRLNRYIPQNDAGNQDLLFGRFHVFF